jgi:alpha-galactosidase
VSGAIRGDRLGDRRTWLLETAHTAWVISVDAHDVLRLEHWGAASPGAAAAAYLPATRRSRPSEREFLDGEPLAYPVYGDPTFKEPCLCVVYADGVRIARLRFIEARQGGTDPRPTLELTFGDATYGLHVTHHFEVFPQHDIVQRSVRLKNGGRDAVRVERMLSAALPFEPGEYELWSLHGQWGREFQLARRALGPGKVVVESRRGFTSAEANPWFALARRDAATETTGAVWFGALAWSGSWASVFEVEANGALHVVAGVQPFDFAWHLGPGEELAAPLLATGYSAAGLGGASALLQRFVVDEVLPATCAARPRPVLYNSWEATAFAVHAEQQRALARRAAALGVELFVVDDGWFGARDSDVRGLGDWVVNREKFPRGLGELADAVHGLGMRFGLWVEPEMVNPDSDLFRAHPDWALHFPNREASLWRNQLVLNFARVDVRQAILGQLQALLRTNPIDFLKWDHNRPLTEVGWPAAPSERQREVWLRHVWGVYEVLSALREEFSALAIESCASGGGRADLGILRYTDQVWTSDNTDAADRLAMQYGYSRAYPARTMVNWVTDVPNQQTGRTSPLRFRFHVAMQGVLGIGGDIGRWSDAECGEAAALVEDYRRIRPIVQLGLQHWLAPPAPLGVSAVQYVSAAHDATVLMLYQVRGVLGAGACHLRLRGLDPARAYRRHADGVETTGAALMAGGVPVHLVGDWQSELQEWTAG